LILTLCFSIVGCAGLNPKNWGKASSNGRSPDRAGERRDNPNSDLPPDSNTLSARTPESKGSGVLAGQVQDAFYQRRGGAVILIAPANSNASDAPREIVANDQGYFMVEGLNAGQSYKLTARAKRGEKDLGGATVATPPNVVLVIRVSEELFNVEPTPKSNSGVRKHNESKPPAATRQPNRHEEANPPPRYLAEPDRGNAERINPNPHQPRPPALLPPTTQPDLITRDSSRDDPPLARIPGPGPAPTLPERQPAPRQGNLAVPSCIVGQNKLDDFALPDLRGGVYQWSQQKGKLTLLDFWGTWCQPCLQAIPELADLERRYGSRGLQVIGIAYEDGTPTEQQERLNFVRQRHGINYRILLGEGDSCPVKTKLAVQGYPTLILLDEHGQLVWMGEGMTANNKARLEAELRARLGD
jgi:thiol-disulfide isomerase/thioredoxin